ncbi:MAG: DNA polymerase III subunit delta' [Marinilabilia sp.]
MLFSDVIGHKSVKDHLIRMVQEERISHAQLFTGVSGSGTLPMAMAFAQYVNCQNPGPDDSCGVCPSCKKMARLVHPDFHFVFPVVRRSSSRNPVSQDFMDQWREFVSESPYFTVQEWFSFLNTEKTQGLIYTEEGSEIVKKLTFKTFEGKYKVMIVWHPEKMHNSGANRLLKILEEPPPRTLFILVSDYPAGILPTILSRAQQVKFPGIDEQAMTEGLVKSFGISPEEAHPVARASQGDFIKARELVGSSEEKQFFFEMFRTAMRHAFSGSLEGLISWVDKATALPKERLKELLLYCIQILRESYMANFSIEELVFEAPYESQFIRKFSPFVKESNVRKMVDEYAMALAHIEQNGNTKLVLFDMALKVSRLFRKTNNLI